MKTAGGFRKTGSKGTERTQLAAWWVGAAYNLARMAKLAAKRCETRKQLMDQQRKVDSIEQTMLMILSSVLDCASKFCPPGKISSFKLHFSAACKDTRCRLHGLFGINFLDF
jgi:hypothetical protein